MKVNVSGKKPDGVSLIEWKNENWVTILETVFLKADDCKLEEVLKDGFDLLKMICLNIPFDLGFGMIQEEYFQEVGKVILLHLLPKKWANEFNQWKAIISLLFFNTQDFKELEDSKRNYMIKILEKAVDGETDLMRFAHQFGRFSDIGRKNGEAVFQKKESLFYLLKDLKDEESIRRTFEEEANDLAPPVKDVMEGLTLFAIANCREQ